MGLLSTIANGAAQLLAGAGVGLWVPSGVYPTTPAQPPIYVGVSPATPDQTIVLTPYGVEDTIDGHGTYGLQVRIRGTRDPRSAYDLDDACWQVLHRPDGLTLADGTTVLTAAISYRRSGPAPIGQDSNGRPELTSNYYLVVPRESSSAWTD